MTKKELLTKLDTYTDDTVIATILKADGDEFIREPRLKFAIATKEVISYNEKEFSTLPAGTKILVIE